MWGFGCLYPASHLVLLLVASFYEPLGLILLTGVGCICVYAICSSNCVGFACACSSQLVWVALLLIVSGDIVGEASSWEGYWGR